MRFFVVRRFVHHDVNFSAAAVVVYPLSNLLTLRWCKPSYSLCIFRDAVTALCPICCLSAVILLCILLSLVYHVVDLHKLMLSFWERLRLSPLRNLVLWFKISSWHTASGHCQRIKLPIVSIQDLATQMPPDTTAWVIYHEVISIQDLATQMPPDTTAWVIYHDSNHQITFVLSSNTEKRTTKHSL